MFELYFPKKTKCIQVSLSENVERTVKLNQITLCVYGLSKGCNTGITEHINSENSGNDEEDDQKGKICMLQILLQLPQQSIYSIQGKFELNQKMLCASIMSK